MERIIERQLYEADIHQIAVLITRLRRFKALNHAGCWFGTERFTGWPLPNLEPRSITTNSLVEACLEVAMAKPCPRPTACKSSQEK